jgi:RND family efflux transporter MFP subunit
MLAALAATGTQAQMSVRVAEVVEAPIVEELPLTGTVLSPQASNIVTQEGGLVRTVHVDVGDRVDRGELLLQLDDSMTGLELQRLEALREEARLMYEEAGRLADEGRRLIADRNISQTEYNARLANEASREKQLRQITTQTEMQQLRVARHRLEAPFEGVIGIRYTQIGQWLNPGTPAFQLVQMDPLRVQASIPERYFGELTAGTAVTIEVDAIPGRSIEATVDKIVPVTDSDTRSFIARIDVANSDYALAPGMSAHLVFHLAGSARAVLQVPADAVIYRPDGSAVIWLAVDGRARSVPVTIGRRSGGVVEVAGTDPALRPGSLVVTLGNESLSEGEAVKPVAR